MSELMVSVVMPAYNCERYIDKAISSVLAQKASLELVIVEDRSTDNTAEVIKPFLSDSRIIYIQNEHNMGAAASRNAGVKRALGKYIAFLDADDCWREDKLEKQLKLMEEKNAVLSSTGRQIMTEEGRLTDRYMGIPEEITYKQLLRGNVLNTSGVMIRTDMARKYPMTQEQLHEDYITWLSILKEGYTAYGLDEPLLMYRLMQGTKSGNKLKSARMTYGVYRYMGYNVPQSLYYFICYAVNGVRKYM